MFGKRQISKKKLGKSREGDQSIRIRRSAPVNQVEALDYQRESDDVSEQPTLQIGC